MNKVEPGCKQEFRIVGFFLKPRRLSEAQNCFNWCSMAGWELFSDLICMFNSAKTFCVAMFANHVNIRPIGN